MEIWLSSDRNNFAQFFLRHRVEEEEEEQSFKLALWQPQVYEVLAT